MVLVIAKGFSKTLGKLKKFLTLVNFMMQDSVVYMAEASLVAFALGAPGLLTLLTRSMERPRPFPGTFPSNLGRGARQ